MLSKYNVINTITMLSPNKSYKRNTMQSPNKPYKQFYTYHHQSDRHLQLLCHKTNFHKPFMKTFSYPLNSF